MSLSFELSDYLKEQFRKMERGVVLKEQLRSEAPSHLAGRDLRHDSFVFGDGFVVAFEQVGPQQFLLTSISHPSW